MEDGLEVNAEETKYMFMFRDLHAILMYSFKTGNKFCSRVKQLKYWGQPSQIKIAFMKKLREG